MTQAMSRPTLGTHHVLTLTSMKGGVGKTTISAMLARYAVGRDPHPVVLLDLDPQAGLSSILLGGSIEGPTVADILQAESRGMPTRAMFLEAIRPSRFDDRILVIPSNASLAQFGSSVTLEYPALLASVLDEAPIPNGTLVIVDTGSGPGLVSLGIHAADTLVIPIMFSQQTARPTINTLMLARQIGCSHGALAPVGMGKTQWESKELNRWRKQLLQDETLAGMGFGVLPSLPFSKTIVRGRWRYGAFPRRHVPFFEAILDFVQEVGPQGRTDSAGASDVGKAPRGTTSASLGRAVPVHEDAYSLAGEGVAGGR